MAKTETITRPAKYTWSKAIIPNRLYLIDINGCLYIQAIDYSTDSASETLSNLDFSDVYARFGLSSSRSFVTTGLAKQDDTGGLSGQVHAVMFALGYNWFGIYVKNLSGGDVHTFINGMFILPVN